MQAQQNATPRVGVTAADKDIMALARYPCEGASVVWVGALCDTPGATMTCKVILWDAVGAYVASTKIITFTAGATPIDGEFCVATPDPEGWFPLAAGAFSVHVDAVHGGQWSITLLAQ